MVVLLLLLLVLVVVVVLFDLLPSFQLALQIMPPFMTRQYADWRKLSLFAAQETLQKKTKLVLLFW
jgi:hypothetical protein